MTKYFIIAFVLVQLTSVVCDGQGSIDSNAYRLVIDSTITKEVDRKIRSGMLTAILDVTYYENGTKKDILLFTGAALPHLSYGIASKDSLTIVLMSMMGASSTFFIDRSKNSWTVSFVSAGRDHTPSYRLHPGDTAQTNVIPCTYYLRMNRDQFKAGDSVYGYIEAISQPFYSRVNGKDIMKKMECKGYFKVEQLENAR